VDRFRGVTDRIGFVATAVGDHPELARILESCRRMGVNVALSSLRIPAMQEEILSPLALSGARSVTLAPETGTDDLRRKLNKPITNASILEAVSISQRCGIPDLKMYFIIGLPGEGDQDLVGIARLLKETREVMLAYGRKRGKMGTLHAGFNVLVPKPYTPYAREAMLTRAEARRKLAVVHNEIAGLPNLKIDRPAYREALWQAFLSRGNCSSFAAIEDAASGTPLGQLLARHRNAVEASTQHPVEGEAVWQFITSAPQRRG
jgi:radical SAM superfamily enzyme YgiQ (UPF0313 family)